jgi:hypothetical protein
VDPAAPGLRIRNLPLRSPALDDLEPSAAGSFVEIVLACDLDILSDEDYRALSKQSRHDQPTSNGEAYDAHHKFTRGCQAAQK